MQIIIIRNYVLKSGSGLKKTQTEPDLSTNGRDLPEARITFAKYLLAGEQNCIFLETWPLAVSFVGKIPVLFKIFHVVVAARIGPKTSCANTFKTAKKIMFHNIKKNSRGLRWPGNDQESESISLMPAKRNFAIEMLTFERGGFISIRVGRFSLPKCGWVCVIRLC